MGEITGQTPQQTAKPAQPRPIRDDLQSGTIDLELGPGDPPDREGQHPAGHQLTSLFIAPGASYPVHTERFARHRSELP
jgi:hypothetical protein